MKRFLVTAIDQQRLCYVTDKDKPGELSLTQDRAKILWHRTELDAKVTATYVADHHSPTVTMEQNMIPTFTNPRLTATFTDWPLGGSKRGTCTFTVEKNNKGSRILRTTTGKPKASTYSTLCAIVDGDDGRTYLLHYLNRHGHEAISIYQSDNAHAAHFGVNGDYYHPKGAPLFDTLLALINQANS